MHLVGLSLYLAIGVMLSVGTNMISNDNRRNTDLFLGNAGEGDNYETERGVAVAVSILHCYDSEGDFNGACIVANQAGGC